MTFIISGIKFQGLIWFVIIRSFTNPFFLLTLHLNNSLVLNKSRRGGMGPQDLEAMEKMNE